MGFIHNLWALALWTPPHRLIMGTEQRDFWEWIEQIDQEYDRYLTMCAATNQTPCSREVIFHEARHNEVQPAVLLRARTAQKKP